MTPNHIECMDKALFRSVRVDRKFSFNEMLSNAFRSFNNGVPQQTVHPFVRKVAATPETNEARSIATFQEQFIQNRNVSVEACADNVDMLFGSYFPANKEEYETGRAGGTP